ncbi:hypothetical protein GOBAR_AA01657 [Gossypium barbadense]|uniref:Uncharacterized protein n=1 Tax=Gossypium barbadense TaxID=3634 RepID=A0A2P5YTI8_GOSBA|nr:hypothetical protein GOBAR_AA01657 [Gossypium barbadense]
MASIQGLETHIGQLAKLISEQPQGSLPSNTESNPREQLNAVAIQDEEGLVARPRPEPMVSEGKNEVGQNEQKSEISSKDTHEPCSIHNKGSTHEEQMLQIEELDEWLTFKPRKYDEPKLRQNDLNASPNQLQVGDKVSLDAADPHIDIAKPNEEIPLTVLSIFPFGTVKVSHPKFGTFKVNNTCLKPYFDEIHSRNEEYKLLEPPSSFNREVYHVKLTWEENPRPHFEKTERDIIYFKPHFENSTPLPPISTRQSGGIILDSTGPTFRCGLLH